ncbi:unnamed protein product [Adineta steineri]|uniref:G-protein coupled receptors family 1 profile domain-containing protein n=1 Tax=Adineta steineri TaxID=433720 RepID=A0A818K634_9BILA|nr:unnamed protein product [Adineta steineri]CAF3549487.1 unnamed protein product [Adineta steineri]
MVSLFQQNNTDSKCLATLSWDQSTVDDQRPILYVCIIASIVHAAFWLQLSLCPSVRQKTMQWLYAYLATDIFLLTRFFFLFIVHTTSTECIPTRAWELFVAYIEAIGDNYLNILEVYILLALNLCRYIQITRNKNVYVTNVRLLVVTHIAIYLLPAFFLIIQLPIGWGELNSYSGNTCDIGYTNTFAVVLNIVVAFVLPIGLNILVIGASVRHVHLTSQLQQAKHHVSAREKYNRSLVIQFTIFYTIWFLLWSPNIIIYQFTSGVNTLTIIGKLLNFIEISIDPIIVAALDVRFYQAWKKTWTELKNRSLKKFGHEQRRIGPAVFTTTVNTVQQRITKV